MREKYTHEMLLRYNAEDEAFNYVDAGMGNEEIRADVEEILDGYDFEVPEDKEELIRLLLKAADRLREEKKWQEYIDSLEQAGENLTREEWIQWINKEADDYDEDINEEDIEYILRVLDEDGFVK